MEPIAIVGIGCRLPGAADPAAFWRLLHDGVDAIGEVPADRWDIELFHDPDPSVPGKMTTRWGGFLDRVDQFDAAFFRISPREARRVDPQQRLLLEVAWEALEDGGQVADRLAGSRTGVFVGISSYDYGALQHADMRLNDPHGGTGSALSIAANRLSYVFDFRGPSLAIDTACSSSLVAVHLACQSLNCGECDLALAAGVNVILSPAVTVTFSKAGFMAADGRCKAFDAAADGYVRGEGAGVVFLKPLARALADRDPIRAVIRATAANQDGRSNGLTAPNRFSQELVLAEAYRSASHMPKDVTYVEAHGTGTALGDPIEAAALGAVLGVNRPADRPCAIGSVKTNIGHLEAAAGIASLIKTTLALEHRQLPPSLHFHQPHPLIPFEQLGLRVQQRLAAWPPEAPPVAGVSGFGFGGTNVHVVLEAAPSADETATDRAEPRDYLVPLSARAPEALKDLARAWIDRARTSEAGVSLADAAYTAGARRAHHPYRMAVVASSWDELAERLDAGMHGESRPGLSVGKRASARSRRIVFVLPGHGSQRPGMGRELLRAEPVFHAALAACDEATRPYLGWSLVEYLSGEGPLEGIDRVQPALFAVQVGLAAVWRTWGIEPNAVIGHSMGEIAAAHVAGILSLEDAARIICRRSALMRTLSGQGAMAVVELPLDELNRALDGWTDRLSIAASNSPTTSVVSGESSAVAALLEELQRDDIFCRRVDVDVASHGPQVDLLRADLLEALAGVRPQQAQVPLYSSVHGKLTPGRRLDAEYWVSNLRDPVLFSTAVQSALTDEYDVFLELSPHPSLLGALKQCFAYTAREAEAVPSLRRDEGERASLLGSLGALYSLGCRVAWDKLYPSEARCVALPAYPWQRERYWLDPPTSANNRSAGEHPLLARHVEVGTHAGLHVWEVDLTHADYVAEHVVDGKAVLPAAAYLEMALSASGVNALESARFEQLLPVDERASVQVSLSDNLCTVMSGPPWTRHATANVPSSPVRLESQSLLETLKQRCGEPINVDALYRRLQASGLDYGERFRSVSAAWRGSPGTLARVQAPAQRGYRIHPVLLDACLQVLGVALDGTGDDGVPVPVGLDRLVLSPAPVSAVDAWCFANAKGDAWLFDDDGTVLAQLSGLHLSRLSRTTGWLHHLRWRPVNAPVAAAERSLPTHWVIVGSGGGLADALRTRLPGRVILAGSRPPEWRAVVERHADSAGVVLLADGEVPPAEAALHLVKAVARTELHTPPRIWLVTAGAQAPDADSDVDPGQATLWGLGRTLALEVPELRSVLVDVGRAEANQQATVLAGELLAVDGEDQVAYRGDHRFVARLMPASLGAGSLELSQDRTCLITGGLGGIGLTTAAWLAERGARWIALIGRRPPTPAAAEAIARIERRGATVAVLRADVSDESQLRLALDGLRSICPPLAGIVHAAGILQDQLLASLEVDSLRHVLAPKIDGTRHLHRLTLDRPLDFFVLFSSAAAVFGSPGQANYAAANAFLDAFAQHRIQLGLPCLSIAWGPWARVGQAAAAPERGERLAAQGFDSIQPEHALELLGRLLAERRSGHVVVSHLNIQRWLEHAPLVRGPLLGLRDDQPMASRANLREAILAYPAGIERRRAIRTHVRRQAAQVLRVATDSLDDDMPLKEIGFDSLLGLELRHHLEASFGLQLSATLVWAHPTVNKIADALTLLLPGSAPERVPTSTVQPLGEDLSEDELAALLSEELRLGRTGGQP